MHILLVLMCVVQLKQKIIVSNESIFFAQNRVLKRGGKKIVLSQLQISENSLPKVEKEN